MDRQLDTLDKEIEAQVRRDFRRKFLAKLLFTLHVILYVGVLLGFILGGYIDRLNPWSSERPALIYMSLIWTALIVLHSTYFYFAHGKGKERREEKIYAEIERRKRLMIESEKLKNDDGVRYELSDDGELFDFDADEMRGVHDNG